MVSVILWRVRWLSPEERIFESSHEKTCLLGFNQVRPNPGCTATEDGLRFETSDLESKGIVLCMKWKQRHWPGFLIWATLWENQLFAYAKTKTQISCAVIAQLISAFVFAIQIEQSLFYINPKFQACSLFLLFYSPVCVRPGQKPRRPVFSQRGSYLNPKFQASSHLLWLCSPVCVKPGQKRWLKTGSLTIWRILFWHYSKSTRSDVSHHWWA